MLTEGSPRPSVFRNGLIHSLNHLAGPVHLEQPTAGAFADEDVARSQLHGPGDVAAEELVGRFAPEGPYDLVRARVDLHDAGGGLPVVEDEDVLTVAAVGLGGHPGRLVLVLGLVELPFEPARRVDDAEPVDVPCRAENTIRPAALTSMPLTCVHSQRRIDG